MARDGQNEECIRRMSREIADCRIPASFGVLEHHNRDAVACHPCIQFRSAFQVHIHISSIYPNFFDRVKQIGYHMRQNLCKERCMNLSYGKKVVYALGQFGLVLSAFGAGSLFVTFFVTRSFSDTVLFPVFLHQGYFFGFFTAAGLVIALSKLVEAAGGLFFGYASDRNTM